MNRHVLALVDGLYTRIEINKIMQIRNKKGADLKVSKTISFSMHKGRNFPAKLLFITLTNLILSVDIGYFSPKRLSVFDAHGLVPSIFMERSTFF